MIERSREIPARGRLSLEEILGPEPSYFDFQAYVGTTKHMGGLKATEELIELCSISESTYVLDVGCGVGATSCYLAKRYGCAVVGVDLSERMIDRSIERARRRGVQNRVEFKVADVQKLPFADGLFDVVIDESATTFVEDKQRAIDEYVRVTRAGGYVGLNEVVWTKTPPPTALVEYARRMWGLGASIATSDGWEELLAGSGLRDVVVRTYRIEVLRESSRIGRYGLGDLSRLLYRALSLSIRSSAFRSYMKETRRVPRGFFEYLGYGIYAGRI